MSLLTEETSSWAATLRRLVSVASYDALSSHASASLAPSASRNRAYRSVSVRSRLKLVMCSSRMIVVEQSCRSGALGAKFESQSLVAILSSLSRSGWPNRVRRMLITSPSSRNPTST